MTELTNRLRLALPVFGFLIPILPLLGNGVYLFVIFSFIFCCYRNISGSIILSALPFLFLITTWTICYLVFSLGWQGLVILHRWHGLQGIVYWITQPASLFNHSLQSLIRYTFFFLLCGIFAGQPEARRALLKGLVYGLLLSFLIFALDLAGWTTTFTRTNSFWISIGRYSGTFSDPNAMGIFMAIVLPFLWQEFRLSSGRVKIVMSLALLATLTMGASSGSRSFVLALFLYTLFITYTHFRRYLARFVVVGIFGLMLSLLLVPSFMDIPFESPTFLPASLERAVNTLFGSGGNDSISGRIIFNKLGFSLFLTSPFLGIGFENFRFLVGPQATLLGINLAGWVDNNNNFYIGLLAELGIIGAILWFVYLLRLKYNFTDRYGTAAFFSLAILLLFGPHLHFNEVSVLAALVIGAVTTKNTVVGNKYAFGVLLLIPVIFVPVKAARLDMGWFPEEGHRSGAPYSWSSVAARRQYFCDSGKINLDIRAIHPNITSEPVNVRLAVDGIAHSTVKLTDTNVHHVVLNCHSDNRPVTIDFVTDPPWSPGLRRKSGDKRILGIQLMRGERGRV